ncbi:hypothetical protein [Streptomyces barkulensis]|uniref:hypothetical protein n=1 Tax=Streptomyces barkulensis TaxID=1257026 RepID=UPI001F0CFC57|nr:hypothetical protein [Streptomyces barkulensis]
MFRTSREALLRAAVVAAAAVAALTACQPEDLPADDVPASAVPGASAAASPSASQPAAPDGQRSLVDAAEAGGLRKRTGEGAAGDVPVDPGEMRDGMRLVVSRFAGPDGGDPVLFEGVDNVPEDTNKRREHLFRGMLEYIEWDPELGQPLARPVADPGPLGGSVECLMASLAENGQVVCGWADESTAAVALFPDSTLDEAGKLFVAMRGDLER